MSRLGLSEGSCDHRKRMSSMRSLIKRYRGLSIGACIIIILFFVCSSITLILNNYSRVNKMLWEWSKPEKYYFKINYYHACSRTWESVWQNDKLISIISDETPAGDLCTEEALNIANIKSSSLIPSTVLDSSVIVAIIRNLSISKCISAINSIFHVNNLSKPPWL